MPRRNIRTRRERFKTPHGRRCSGAQSARPGKAGHRRTHDGGEHPYGWGSRHSAGCHACLWTEMLANDVFGWLQEHGSLTRANGDHFRRMVLPRGNIEDLARMYAAWRSRAPNIDTMKKDRELETQKL